MRWFSRTNKPNVDFSEAERDAPADKTASFEPEEGNDEIFEREMESLRDQDAMDTIASMARGD